MKMELKEDKQLAAITKVFTEAIKVFAKRNYKEALGAFVKLVEAYKNSDFYSVMEIRARAGIYKNICEAQLNPVAIELVTDSDYLNHAVYSLNAGDYPKAVELLNQLQEKEFEGNYVNYLLALTHARMEDAENALTYLRKAVEADETYKVIAHNESNFDTLFENEEFLALVEI
ncbi:MAG: hypothetical protein GY765_44090 [bacterium]|nr:hypothetical protein [bacterium]